MKTFLGDNSFDTRRNEHGISVGIAYCIQIGQIEKDTVNR
jgi:hypothetical protein